MRYHSVVSLLFLGFPPHWTTHEFTQQRITRITKSCHVYAQISLRSKRFCGVREQRIAARKWLSLPIFQARKTPKIPFFAPKPHGNACYAGYAQIA